MAKVNMSGGVETAVAIFVVFILVANLLPTAVSQIFNITADPANGTSANWTSEVITLWELLPLLGIIAVVLLAVKWAMDFTK